MATDLAQTFVVKPDEPAATVPGLKDLAASMVDPTATGIAKAAVQMVPPPTTEQFRAAELERTEARSDYLRRQTKFDEAFKPQLEAFKQSAQRYAEDAKKVPKPGAVQAPPGRGLEPFLSPTKDESPYATIAKFMQSISLLAMMAGGGRAGARASMSALTGALEGWREGNREKADRNYQTWKDTTETMFRSFDDEMRAYNSLMIAERVPLEQKLRALDLEAFQHKNEMLMAELRMKDADKAWAALEKMRETSANAMMDFAKIVGQKEAKDAEIAKAMELERLRNAAMLEVAKITAAGRVQAAEVAAAGRRESQDKKQEPKDAARRQVYTLIDQIEALIPAMQKKGFLSTGTGSEELLKARAKRSEWLPGIGKAGDPDLVAWKAHAGTMVSIQRQLGDIGPRALAAYQSAINIIEHPTSAAGARQALENLRAAIQAGEPGVSYEAPTATAPAQAGPPTGALQGGWRIERVK